MGVIFNGSSQGLAATSAIVSAWPLTFSAWIWVAANQATKTIMSIGSTASANPLNLMGTQGAGNVWCQVRDLAGTTSSSTGTVPSLSAWHHVAASISSTGVPLVYLDAVKALAGTDPATTMGSCNRTSVGFLRRTTDSQFFAGIIADAAIWKVVLSDADVALLAGTASPLSVRPDALVGYWPMAGNSFPEQDFNTTAPPIFLTPIAGHVPAPHAPVRPYRRGLLNIRGFMPFQAAASGFSPWLASRSNYPVIGTGTH
jgi:hypothetical protein